MVPKFRISPFFYAGWLLFAAINLQCSSDDLQAPMADFSADVTEVSVGGQVNFMDQSTGVVDIMSWTFPGGDPATFSSPSPTVTYSTPGVYDVILEVSNPAGTDIETKTGYITVNFEAEFSVDKTTISAGETVFFTDETTGSPIEWTWTFTGGDPASSNIQDVAVTYNTAGTYDVSLEVSDGNSSDTEIKVGYITVQ